MSCDEDVTEHTCDERKELRFKEFGDATGVWKDMHPEHVPECGLEWVETFEFMSDGSLKIATMGCNINDYPLVLNDYNGFQNADFVGTATLVAADVRSGYIRLNYTSKLWKLDKEFENEGHIEFHRVGPNRMTVRKRLPLGGWCGSEYRRVYNRSRGAEPNALRGAAAGAAKHPGA